MATENLLPEPLETPLQNIALTFSGGGFRAASYSLGTLSYLDHIQFGEAGKEDSLLKNVSYISSTSGGSITNGLYSAYIHQGKIFADVYKKLLAELAGQKLLDKVFEILNDDKEWNKKGNGKEKNFINAFAKVYDKILYEGETFEVFWNKDHIPSFEVCFNSTEFYRGLSFRFQTEGKNGQHQIIGNNFLYFETDELAIVKKLKLADMVAASSCFPAGFEPIIYPEDFSYADSNNQLSIAELNKALVEEDYDLSVKTISASYGFMDGGITDNQGLKSAMIADERRRRRKGDNHKPFDLIMVTDVASYFMDEYKVPTAHINKAISNNSIDEYGQQLKKGIGKYTNILKWSFIISLLFFIASFVAIFIIHNNILQYAASFIAGISFIVFLLCFFVKKNKLVHWVIKNKQNIKEETALNNFIRSEKFASEKLMKNLLYFLRVTKISTLEKMLKTRMASMMSMLLDVNLKQTRRLIYEMFYDNEIWNNRRVSNFIYELSSYNKESRVNRFSSSFRLGWDATPKDETLLLRNCEKLALVAENARTMGTTLWFDAKDEGKLKDIIATGQFTTCYNLLVYIIALERNEVPFSTVEHKKLTTLKEKLTTDFLLFKNDPYYLCDKI
jgi:Patatin-like phospholipase